MIRCDGHSWVWSDFRRLFYCFWCGKESRPWHWTPKMQAYEHHFHRDEVMPCEGTDKPGPEVYDAMRKYGLIR